MSHWQKYHLQWEKVGPPLRVDAQVVETVRALIGDPDDPVLLLGVTPELAAAFSRVHAVDRNPAMVANVWPGDAAGKRAVVGDWLEISDPPGTYAAVVGDGSLNNIAHPGEISRLLRLALDLLPPGGRFACRLYERPMKPFTLRHLEHVARAAAPVNFHAFKWQLAMHLAEELGANVPVALILKRFEEMFPDRGRLAARTGWPRRAIDTIDIYRGSLISYSFPSRAEFHACLPAGAANVEFRACGDYDMAACCPILTFRKPAA